MTGPNGRCFAFDAKANGFGRGEGCGMLVVKRLQDAISHGDHIFSVICGIISLLFVSLLPFAHPLTIPFPGIATNHDGKTNGFTAPSRQAQEQVIETALQKAGLIPSDIGFLETRILLLSPNSVLYWDLCLCDTLYMVLALFLVILLKCYLLVLFWVVVDQQNRHF
jgi:hypothetical protein